LACLSSRVPFLLLAALAAGACRPVAVTIDCPPTVEAETEFDVVFTVEKSGADATFEVEFSWSSPTQSQADITYVAVDDEALEEPETSGYLTVTDVPEGDLSITAFGTYCPEAEGTTCWGTLTASGSALKNGAFGADRESDACIIEYTLPPTP